MPAPEIDPEYGLQGAQYASHDIKTGGVVRVKVVYVDANNNEIDPRSITSSALPSGAATSAKQLPDNHQVTVSNPTTNPETGLAKETTLAKIPGLSIPIHDEMVLSYTGSNLTGIVYKLATATVATLTLSYTGDNLTGVIKS